MNAPQPRSVDCDAVCSHERLQLNEAVPVVSTPENVARLCGDQNRGDDGDAAHGRENFCAAGQGRSHSAEYRNLRTSASKSRPLLTRLCTVASNSRAMASFACAISSIVRDASA